MNGRKYITILFVIVFVFLGFRFLIYPDRVISEEKIALDIERQINKTLKENHNIDIENIDAKIELFEDILTKRFVVYSFNNPLAGYRHTGYAVYEIRLNEMFKRINFGWNSSTFNVYHLNFEKNFEDKRYLMVYGMNKANEKQIYEYSSGSDQKIVEFSGDYFLKKYISDGNSIGFANVNQK